MTRHTLSTFLLGVALASAACGDHGSSPMSPTPRTSLAGTWRGMLELRVNGQVPTTAPITWTFVDAPEQGGIAYDSRATLSDPWLPLTNTYLHATLVGQQFGANGTYRSPRGCEGSMAWLGSGDSRRIEASLTGSSACDATFAGHLTLSKE